MSSFNLAYSPKEIYAELEIITQAGLVPMITGSPGTSKSAIVAKFSKDYGLKLIDCRLGTMMPEDLNGLPMREGKKATFAPFDLFPVEGDPLPKGYQGWLIFFDEITSAMKPTQAAAYKIILDKMVGSLKLHENVVMVAAGNKMTDKAVVNAMSTALQSRMIHLELEPNVDDWTEHALKSGFDQRVIAYVNEMPSRLMNFKPEVAGTEKNFPCPRTLEFLSRLVKGRDVTEKNLGRFAGCIGQGAAIEFITFCKLYGTLPKVSDIIADPVKTNIPNEASAKYAVMFMLVEHADAKSIDPILVYMKRFGIDQQIVFSRAVHSKNPTLLEKNQNFVGYMQDMLRYMQAA